MESKKRINSFFIIATVVLLLTGLFAGYYFLFRPNYYILNLNDRNSVLPQKNIKRNNVASKAFTSGTKNYLSSLQNNLVKSAEVVIIHSGKIKNISVSTGNIAYDTTLPKIAYATSLSLNSSSTIPSTLFFTKNDLQNLRIMSKDGKMLDQSSLSSLKAGDVIEITEILDPLKPMGQNRKSVVIVKK